MKGYVHCSKISFKTFPSNCSTLLVFGNDSTVVCQTFKVIFAVAMYTCIDTSFDLRGAQIIEFDFFPCSLHWVMLLELFSPAPKEKLCSKFHQENKTSKPVHP